MGRLGVDASRVLAAARELARKHRHETLEPEHLLAALLSDDRMEHVLSEHAVDGSDLGERVTAHLVDRPTAGLYRDARVLTLYEGTSEIQRLVIARNVLKA